MLNQMKCFFCLSVKKKKILINLSSQGILNLAKVQMLPKISDVKFFEKISVWKSPVKAYAYTQTKLFSIANVLRATIELIILKRTGKYEKGILFKIKLTSWQKYPQVCFASRWTVFEYSKRCRQKQLM